MFLSQAIRLPRYPPLSSRSVTTTTCAPNARIVVTLRGDALGSVMQVNE